MDEKVRAGVMVAFTLAACAALGMSAMWLSWCPPWVGIPAFFAETAAVAWGMIAFGRWWMEVP